MGGDWARSHDPISSLKETETYAVPKVSPILTNRKETMPRDLSEITDDYCRENYGHSNWGYLDHYTKHEPEKLVDESTYDIEDGKVFWHEEDREEDLQQC